MATGFLLVADISEPSSLRSLSEYYQQVLRVKDTNIIPAVLAINKKDSNATASFTLEEAKQFSREHLHDIPVYETSARDDHNVTECFHRVVQLIRLQKQEKPKQKKKSLFN
jgi:GTPase KRas protein